MSIERAWIPRFDPVPTMHLKKKESKRGRERKEDTESERVKGRMEGKKKEEKNDFLPTEVLSTQVKDTWI